MSSGIKRIFVELDSGYTYEIRNPINANFRVENETHEAGGYPSIVTMMKLEWEPELLFDQEQMIKAFMK